MNLPWHLYAMALLYILAGINHFRVPRLYKKIIPSYLPNHGLLNVLSGAIEVVLGVALLIPFLTIYAAWGVMLLLIAVYPAHIYMITHTSASMGLPRWVLFFRLLLQLVLLYWAYIYTQ